MWRLGVPLSFTSTSPAVMLPWPSALMLPAMVIELVGSNPLSAKAYWPVKSAGDGAVFVPPIPPLEPPELQPANQARAIKAIAESAMRFMNYPPARCGATHYGTAPRQSNHNSKRQSAGSPDRVFFNRVSSAHDCPTTLTR